MTTTDPDRMQFAGYLPDVDPSAEDRPRTNRAARRDYDLLLLPSVTVDRDGIDATRTVLDKAELDIAEYQARESDDPAATAKALAGLAGRRIGRALGAIAEARALLYPLLDDEGSGLTAADRDALAAALDIPLSAAGLRKLRRACAVIEGTAPKPGPAVPDSPAPVLKYPDITLAEAAKAVRADIKAALAGKTLPHCPDGIKIRVRGEHASLMTSIDIHVDNAPATWTIASPERRAMDKALTEIASRYYTPDNRGSFISVYTHRKDAGNA
jgi:hypothetical protein